MVVFNVIAPYSKRDFKVIKLILDAQILSSCFLAVSLLHITVCATLSVQHNPRETKDLTSLMSPSQIVTGHRTVVLICFIKSQSF